ncbi:glycogen/starch/alpha-glucan phosphorylase [Allobaculum mucilyticum]|uniref:glycogen/starch/alpha-glucan phosphorylase n=1 Tax=Allobaculum mucilyticum TaxID=2834459 RepID=UPI001E454931|nr:glycogen/starch/alpha-glucan phosphorylase [Allobaculum mucilyticum]
MDIDMNQTLQNIASHYYGKELKDCTDREVYYILLDITKELMKSVPVIEGDRKLYYISAEFLIGKLLSNNLLNLGIYADVRKVLEENGISLAAVEEYEPEPSLGNGGLGRLAACFLDSIATLELPGDGVGLNYHLGLFHQAFQNYKQKELPDPWLSDNSWLNDTGKYYPVEFGDRTVHAHLYSIDVCGYSGKKNALKLFDLDTVNEAIVTEGIDFDKSDIEENLTLFLYPDDSDEKGRLLRVYQQYFLVSAGAQMIIEDVKAHGWPLTSISDHAVIQINDTHPSMVIPELIRLLMNEGLTIDQAIEQTEKTCAYTNHTILAEALEKWPESFLEKVAPQIVPIIEELDRRAKERSDNPKTAIIDDNGLVHMAHMDIHFSKSTNGVAKIHTDILKNTELHDFYELYPEKFNNKTNGITFRRWLQACNPQLTDWIISKIGDGFLTDSDELEKLLPFVKDKKALAELADIKMTKKKELAVFMKKRQNIDLDVNSIFDIQVKRLHEYKRQQMNLLSAINLYQEIKNGYKPEQKVTIIFGAKAAPAYILAKDIIHAILVFSQIVDSDPEVNKYMQVVMVENYDVTCAEKLIPAADISEQISLASKEASGTSNMKFMLNGAVTLGTDDGANVEIHDLVGGDNIFIFGTESEDVIESYAKGDYHPQEVLEKEPNLDPIVNFLVGEEMMALGDPECLHRLHHDITTKDWFMALRDLDAYMDERKKAYAAYADKDKWFAMALTNIAMAGYFSSDRTIAQYNDDIWKLK